MTKRRLPLVSPDSPSDSCLTRSLRWLFLPADRQRERRRKGKGSRPPAQETEATPEATEEPVFHTKTPVPVVPPTSTPLPVHPQGIDGCKSAVMFQSDDLEGFSDFMGCCLEQLMISMETCLQESSPEAQRRCGEGAADEYSSYYLRYSSLRCAAIEDLETRHDCMIKSNDDFNKALGDMYGAWEKVRIGAEGDTAVAEAWKDTTTCLEEQGFKDVDRDLLFVWQRLRPLAEWEAYEKGLSPDEGPTHSHGPARQGLRQGARPLRRSGQGVGGRTPATEQIGTQPGQRADQRGSVGGP